MQVRTRYYQLSGTTVARAFGEVHNESWFTFVIKNFQANVGLANLMNSSRRSNCSKRVDTDELKLIAAPMVLIDLWGFR